MRWPQPRLPREVVCAPAPPRCDESPNEHVKRYASGALFNCVEAIHREVERNKADEQARQKKKTGMFTKADEGKTYVDIIDRLVNGHKARRRAPPFSP